MRKVLLFVLVLAAVGVGAWFFLRDNETGNPKSNQATSQQDTEQSTPSASSFDKKKYSLSEPGSLWMIANKQHALPGDYVPADLQVPDVRLRLGSGAEQMQFRGVAAGDLKKMFDAAAKDGITLVFGSGYRSYALQKQFYDSYVAKDGQAAADRYSARPGTSEHQTGLAFDATTTAGTCHLETCFEGTSEGKWLAGHAHQYGFTLRYKNGKESVTGYQYEPWHFRYVGRELATELQKSNQTMEEFFNL